MSKFSVEELFGREQGAATKTNSIRCEDLETRISGAMKRLERNKAIKKLLRFTADLHGAETSIGQVYFYVDREVSELKVQIKRMMKDHKSLEKPKKGGK